MPVCPKLENGDLHRKMWTLFWLHKTRTPVAALLSLKNEESTSCQIIERLEQFEKKNQLFYLKNVWNWEFRAMKQYLTHARYLNTNYLPLKQRKVFVSQSSFVQAKSAVLTHDYICNKRCVKWLKILTSPVPLPLWETKCPLLERKITLRVPYNIQSMITPFCSYFPHSNRITASLLCMHKVNTSFSENSIHIQIPRFPFRFWWIHCQLFFRECPLASVDCYLRSNQPIV